MVTRPNKLSFMVPLAAFCASALVLIVIALFVYQHQRDERRASVEAGLKAVAELKIEQLENWLAERRGDIRFVGAGSLIANQFDRWLAQGGQDQAALAQIHARMRFLAQAYGYDTFTLFDLDGRARIQNEGPDIESTTAHQADALNAIRHDQPVLIDFHRHPGEPIRVGMVGPLKLEDAAGSHTIGAILMTMPADKQLFPMLQRWPLASRKGETVLARREGNEILFIVTAKAEPMSIRVSASKSDLPVVQIERGKHGILHAARDYMGDPVLAYADRVPGTPWLLVVKQDQSEVDTPLEQLARWLGLALTLLLAGTGAVIWYWWRAQESHYRSRILEQELEQAVLTEQARNELQASEAKYRILADYSADWEYWVGADRQFRYVSPACEAICGYAPADFYANPGLLEQIIHPDDLPRWRDHLAIQRDALNPSHDLLNLRIRSRQGEERWIEHICTSVFSEAGEYLGQRGSNRDITARKRAEAALHESRSRFKLLIDEAPVPMCFVTRDGALQYINQRFIETFGYRQEDIPTLNEWWQLACPEPEYRAWVQAKWSAAVADAQAGNVDIEAIEYRVTSKYGQVLNIEISGVTIGEDLLATFYDVTERRLIEQERAQYQARLEAEVRQRTLDLFLRTTELETANHDLENFSYSVSHDLRAPLRAIDGFIAILLDEHAASLDAEGRRMFGIVSDNARKMGQLIDDILAFSRAGRLELDPVPVDMQALVKEVWSGLIVSREGRAIELQMDDLPTAECDPRALRQVWQNLLDNAVKFTRGRQPAIVRVSAADEGDYIRFQVADNGVGFNADYADKLFILFQRLHGMDEFEGTGVGLAIVKRIIQKHGGQVSAAGVVDQGASFSFTLPKRHQASLV